MSQEIRKNLSANIQFLRKKKRITSENLSIWLEFDNSYISKVENCRVNITLDRIAKIAEYFEIEPYKLLK